MLAGGIDLVAVKGFRGKSSTLLTFSVWRPSWMGVEGAVIVDVALAFDGEE